MSTVEQIIGPATAEWDEKNPLCWKMSEIVGEGTRAELQSFSFDLAGLQYSYHFDLLVAIKEVLVQRRTTAKLKTIDTDFARLRSVLQRCADAFSESCAHLSPDAPLFRRIDKKFLTSLWALKNGVPRNYLDTFKAFFRRHRHNTAIFEVGLKEGDFPQRGKSDDANPLGKVGQLRKNVLASALSRATLVQILNITEAAFESGELNLGLFAYSRLLLCRAARPESFRLLRLKDLQIDESGGTKTYYLNLSIPKSREAQRPMATIRLHAEVGRILDLQRAAVAERLGPLLVAKNADGVEGSQKYTVGDLPLFPTGVKAGRIFPKARERLGVVTNASCFLTYYSAPLQELTRVKMTHNALRHTIGTQLAIAGCSTPTIAAVLLHATHRAAAVYVDLIFSGAIDELSDSLESAFLEHFPVIKEFASIKDQLDPAQRIVSTTTDRIQQITTGECGRLEICQYAPISCYECPRFKPCYDADHTINLERVMDELVIARDGGLARSIDVKRYTHIANRIRLVISVCKVKREAIAAGKVISDRPA